MRVVPVQRERLSDVIDFSWEINGGDPHWIPPIRAQLERSLAGADIFGSYAQQQLFACEENGRLIARVAAIINPRLKASDGSVIGQVGFFEARNNPPAVAALFDVAISWLRQHGAREIVGPMNGGAQALHRLVVSGFDKDPFLFEPHNPPYYPELFAASGFKPVHSWSTFDFTEEELSRLECILADYLAKHPVQYRVDFPDPHDFAGLTGRIAPLLDRVWASHVGYAYLDTDEVMERNAGVFSLMTTGDVRIAVDAQGRDVGFSLGYPDYAKDVRQLQGDAAAWGRWLGKSIAPRWVHHTIAVIPEVQDGRAAFLLLLNRIRFQRSRGYQRQMAALATNPKWRLYQEFTPSREYVLYGKRVD